MNTTKKTLIVSFIVLILCLLIIGTSFHKGFHSNRKIIQYTDIEKVHVGMSLDSVFLVLGRPYEFSSNLGCHDLTCKHPRDVSDIKMTNETNIVHIIDSIYQNTNYCCKANNISMNDIGKNVTLTYTKRPVFLMSILKSYPMLWVHLDSVYRVRSVYAKYYGADDKCIYSLSPFLSPHEKDSSEEYVELFVDTALFRKCFPTLK